MESVDIEVKPLIMQDERLSMVLGKNVGKDRRLLKSMAIPSAIPNPYTGSQQGPVEARDSTHKVP